jgi:ABC-2 type transport system permease protein
MRRPAGTLRTEALFLRSQAHTLAFALAAPFLFAFVVGSVYSGKKLAVLPVTIVDQDASALSREITSALLATEPFVPGPDAASADDFARLAAEGQSHICFVFPPKFERDVKSGKATSVAVLVDASNLVAGNISGTAAASVLGSYSEGVDVKRMQLHGVPGARARQGALPVSMQTRTLFNPAMNANYANFLVLGMLGVAIQLSSLLATAGLAEWGTSRLILRLAVLTFILGLGAWAAVRMAIACFGLPMLGQEWLLAVVVFWFVGNLVVLGYGISRLAKDAILASQVCALITMPNFLVSGYTWPAFAMPGALRILAYALPMNPLLFALRKISLMGAAVPDLGFEFLLLTGWSAAAFTLALLAGARSGWKAQVARS